MKLSVVLIGTKYSQNIGSCARAMANMGGEPLILISPLAAVNVESYQAAAGAQKYLDQIQKFSTWSDYLKLYPHTFRVGFTARQRKDSPSTPWEDLIKSLKPVPANMHLVFGPEDNGLSKQDLDHCNQITFLSTYGEFKSLNLSQAVLLALYSAQQKFHGQSEWPKSQEELKNLDEILLKNWLLKTGFQLNTPKNNAFSYLKAYFKKHPLTTREKAVLEKALQQSLRKARDK